MAVLRLREGNVERLEHFFTAINASELQTTGGDWALHILMEAMRPLDQDAQTEPAWREIREALHVWQQQKPVSWKGREDIAIMLTTQSLATGTKPSRAGL